MQRAPCQTDVAMLISVCLSGDVDLLSGRLLLGFAEDVDIPLQVVWWIVVRVRNVEASAAVFTG